MLLLCVGFKVIKDSSGSERDWSVHRSSSVIFHDLTALTCLPYHCTSPKVDCDFMLHSIVLSCQCNHCF